MSPDANGHRCRYGHQMFIRDCVVVMSSKSDDGDDDDEKRCGLLCFTDPVYIILMDWVIYFAA